MTDRNVDAVARHFEEPFIFPEEEELLGVLEGASVPSDVNDKAVAILRRVLERESHSARGGTDRRAFVAVETNYWRNPNGHMTVVGVADTAEDAMAIFDRERGQDSDYAREKWDTDTWTKRVNYDGALVVHKVLSFPLTPHRALPSED